MGSKDNHTEDKQLCGCGDSAPASIKIAFPHPDATWVLGNITTRFGDVPRAARILTFQDKLGAWRVRLAIGRMNYRIDPGLYAIGEPSLKSPVLLSANYKLSFDILRFAMGGRDAWILVLDTKGINVWCAAGKETFGTEEIIRQVRRSALADIVSHRILICPQLGAPGVAAHVVKKQTAFKVEYGPVRASDLPAFLDAGMKATPRMRRVYFTLKDRLVLAPVEFVGGFKYFLILAAILLLGSGLGRGGYSLGNLISDGVPTILGLLGAYIAGVVVTPALLPWLPGRPFAVKGVWVGVIYSILALQIFHLITGDPLSAITSLGWALLSVAVTSFLAMNYTGTSTYTSLSGVLKEMKIAIPWIAIAAIAGFVLLLIGRFV